MERAWTQDEIDEDMFRDIEPDVCHHGVGFDEDCERCEVEIAAERATERQASAAQGDMFQSLMVRESL